MPDLDLKDDTDYKHSAEYSRYEIQRSLGRIEGKLDSLSLSFMEHSKDDKEEFAAIKLRTAILEKKFYAAIGALTLVLAVPSFFAMIPHLKSLFN